MELTLVSDINKFSTSVQLAQMAWFEVSTWVAVGFACSWILRALSSTIMRGEEPLVTPPPSADLQAEVDRLQARVALQEAELGSVRLQQEDVLDRLTQWRGRQHKRDALAQRTTDPIAELREQYPTASQHFLHKKAKQLGLLDESGE